MNTDVPLQDQSLLSKACDRGTYRLIARNPMSKGLLNYHNRLLRIGCRLKFLFSAVGKTIHVKPQETQIRFFYDIAHYLKADLRSVGGIDVSVPVVGVRHRFEMSRFREDELNNLINWLEELGFQWHKMDDWPSLDSNVKTIGKLAWSQGS